MSLLPSLRLPVASVVLVALVASGCSHRQRDAEMVSIKDDPVPHDSARQVLPEKAAPMPVQRAQAEPPRKMPSRTQIAARADQSPYDVPRVTRLKGPATVALEPAPQKAEPSPQIAAPKVSALPAPRPPAPIVPVAPQVTEKPAVSATPAPSPKVEFIPAPKAPAPTPSQQAAQPTQTTQNGSDRTQIVMPAPAARSDVAVATGERPATSKAPAVTVPAQANGNKVASLGTNATADALDRADAYLKGGQIINARALLQDAARGENPELLAALAATYDPIVLVDYPAAQKAADAKRAAELYEVAIAKGSLAAKDRLARLKVYMSRQ